MGSHHSHDAKGGGDQLGSGSNTPRGSQRGSGSGGDLQGPAESQDKPPPSMVPIEKLGKLLAQRSQKEDGVNGVTEKSFTKYLFPLYPELGQQFYRLVHRGGACKARHIPLAVFRTHCERVLALLDDKLIVETYVTMFSSDSEQSTVTPECLRQLLYTSYKISMDHYPEGPQTCLMINHTLSAVLKGCFNNKQSHSVGFVVRWLQEHCPRLILPVHRYVVHTLATRHRDIEAVSECAGLELATPVLERALGASSPLLPGSAAWLLAGATAPLYSRPTGAPPPPGLTSLTGSGPGSRAPAAWLARLVCTVPSHWVPLYASNDHGLAANRFLHHTIAYRGPTIVLFQAESLVLALCVPVEWRETHLYWGTDDSALIMMQPTFSVVERAAKMLYLNTSIRGYPLGLRAGSDPRAPLLDVNADFDSLKFKGAEYSLSAVEVWGCGDATSRETQLEIKKWQVKEAERQRCVKLSAADWIEHPDRYLLELAGRPQYNNSAS